MAEITLEELGEAIYKLVKQNTGLKKFKMMDLYKAMQEVYPGQVDKRMVKDAIKQQIDSKRLVYTYFGGSFIELPHEEGAANPENK